MKRQLNAFNRTASKALGLAGAIAAVLAVADPAIAQSDRRFDPPNYRQTELPAALDTADAWETVGRNAAATGDYHNAAIAFDKAIDLARDRNPQLYELRGWAHYLNGEIDAAIADLDTASQLYLNRQRYQAYRNTQQMHDYVLREDADELLPSAPLAIER